MALAPIILVPFIIRIRRFFKKKKPVKVLSRCPGCGKLIGLQEIRSYICGQTVAFRHIETQEVLPGTKFYKCENCQQEVFENILTCTKCGHLNGLAEEEFRTLKFAK